MEASFAEFEELGVKIVAGNADGDPDTAQTHTDHDLSFPVAHTVDVALAEKLGAWVGEKKGSMMIQPCEFVLRPDGSVAASMYATTQLGRMNPQEILTFIRARI